MNTPPTGGEANLAGFDNFEDTTKDSIANGNHGC